MKKPLIAVGLPSNLLLGLLLSLLLGAAGCARPEQVPTPPHLLPKAEVTGLLVELHLLEARLEASRLAPDSARALFLSQQHLLFSQHQLAEQDSAFPRSYRYYAAHDKDLDAIYAAVIDSLSAREKRLGGTPTPRHF